MAKKSSFVNVYTGLFAGVVGGWLLHGLTKKPKTTVVGDNVDYGQGWADSKDDYTFHRPTGTSRNQQGNADYQAGYSDYSSGKSYRQQ